MSFRRYVMTLMCVYLAVAIVAGALATTLLMRFDDLRAEVGDLRLAQLEAVEYESALLDQETGARGFVITGDDRFLDPYEDALNEQPRIESTIRDLIAGDSSLEQALNDVVVAADTWRREAAEREIEMRRVDEEAALELVATGSGRTLFDASRAAQASFEQLLERREHVRNQALVEVRTWFSMVALAAMAVTGLITLLAGWVFVRRLIRPLDRLATSVRAVSAGDLSGHIEVAGTVEMVEVGESVRAMRDQIVRLLNDSVARRQALEQEAILTTQLATSLASSSAVLPAGWISRNFQRPAEGVVAGDCFSVELLSPNTVATLIVIDISGHGANAALQALKARSILSVGLRTGEEPHRAVEMLSAVWTDELFVSTFVAVIDTDRRTLTYVNAGHPPAIVRSADALVELGATGPIILPPLDGWTTAAVDLVPGDLIIIATDGLTEASCPDGEFYGEERFRDVVLQSTSDNVLADVVRDVEAFLDGQPARDDITVVTLRLDARTLAARRLDESFYVDRQISRPDVKQGHRDFKIPSIRRRQVAAMSNPPQG